MIGSQPSCDVRIEEAHVLIALCVRIPFASPTTDKSGNDKYFRASAKSPERDLRGKPFLGAPVGFEYST